MILIYSTVYYHASCLNRLNDRILNKEKSLYLDMSGTPSSINNVEKLLQLSPRDMTATAIENLKYFMTPKKSKSFYPMTYWIVGDLNCQKARNLLWESLNHLVSIKRTQNRTC